jgi:hypothetical protein
MNVHVLPQGHPLLTVGAADAFTHRPFQPGDRVVVCRECKNLYLEETWEQVSRLPRHGGRDNTLEAIPEEFYRDRDLGRPPAMPPQIPTGSNHNRSQAAASPVELRRRTTERTPAVTPNSASPGLSRPRRLELLDPVAPVARRTGPRPRVQLLESWRPSPSSSPIPTPPAPEPVMVSSSSSPPAGRNPLQIPPAVWFAAGVAAAGLLVLLLSLIK